MNGLTVLRRMLLVIFLCGINGCVSDNVDSLDKTCPQYIYLDMQWQRRRTLSSNEAVEIIKEGLAREHATGGSPFSSLRSEFFELLFINDKVMSFTVSEPLYGNVSPSFDSKHWVREYQLKKWNYKVDFSEITQVYMTHAEPGKFKVSIIGTKYKNYNLAASSPYYECFDFIEESAAIEAASAWLALCPNVRKLR